MLRPKISDAIHAKRPASRRIALPVAMVVLQVVAAIFFMVDGIEDQITEARHGFSIDAAMEFVIALALLGGIIHSLLYVALLIQELRWKNHLISKTSGALAQHITLRFREWGLTPGEGEVALFALKGCGVAEIARLRGAATGTVRSQLSQTYTKAGVTSQAMLVSLFIEDLLDTGYLE